MPMVCVQYRSPVSRETAGKLANLLPRIVAEALTCDNVNGRLVARDVEVGVGEIPEGLRTEYDLHITVEANEYPERLKGLALRTALIRIAVREFFRNDPDSSLFGRTPKSWVWVKLFPGEWGKL